MGRATDRGNGAFRLGVQECGDDCLHVEVAGRVGYADAPRFAEAVQEAFRASGKQQMLLDVARVEFLYGLFDGYADAIEALDKEVDGRGRFALISSEGRRPAATYLATVLHARGVQFRAFFGSIDAAERWLAEGQQE